jgi:hypothetical protein
MIYDEHPSLFLYPVLACFFGCMIVASGCASPASTASQATATLPARPTALTTATAENSTARPPVLITPVSDLPAAGICLGPTEGEITGVTIYPDIPDPRCLKITGSQQLQVMNRTDSLLEINLGPYHAVVQPGETYQFKTPFGEFLAPGVHLVITSPYSGPELWLEK